MPDTVKAPTGAALAYQVLDFIAAHPDKHNQNFWAKKTTCGTSGCFAGWAAALASPLGEDAFGKWDVVDAYDDPEGTGIQVSSWIWLDDVNGQDIQERATELLDLTTSEASALFEWKNTYQDLARLVGEIYGPRPE